MRRACVLVFAGSDPSGGAGIQADISTITALGVHPLSVITALTAQDNNRVFAVQPVAADWVRRQADTLTDKIAVAAVKIGIVGNRANAETIAAIIRALRQRQPDLPVVLDTVLASGHGDALTTEDAVQAIAPLLPLATIATPNLPEAAMLCGGERRLDTQAQHLLGMGCRHVLIKGGHGEDDDVINRWTTAGDGRTWTWPRLAGAFHGSGCTLASAIAAFLACGKSVPDALDLAQVYCHEALMHAYSMAAGQSIPNRMVSISRERT